MSQVNRKFILNCVLILIMFYLDAVEGLLTNEFLLKT